MMIKNSAENQLIKKSYIGVKRLLLEMFSKKNYN